jgi:predicted Zn-dependent protease
LGLALVQAGHFDDARSYLSGVVKADPQNGPAWMGLAEISLAADDKQRAQELYRQAFSREWPAQEESRRRGAQLKYGALLSAAGRRGEAASILLSMIEQHGDDPAIAKQAAEAIKTTGTPEQVEQAYAALASHFPADPGVWLRLGDVRLAAEKELPALDAYRHAAEADPDNAESRRTVARVEEILDLDPTRRGLSVRERARRCDRILQRVVDAAAACGASPEIEQAQALLKKRAVSLEVTDQKMAAALGIWKAAPAPCRTDAVLTHVLSKIRE